MAHIRKFDPFTNDVLFVDGMWGTGKSVVAPIIGGMAGVEKQKADYSYEFVCILRSFNKIEPDAACALLQIYADMHQYHNLIGREVNLRWADDTGPKNNPGSLKYVQRIFGPEGDGVIRQIERKNLALQIMSHMILQVADPLVDAFGDRLKIVEMVRHPLYMVTHWYNYLGRSFTKREFEITLEHSGKKIPWFASGWEEEYLASPLMDRVLGCILHLYDMLFTSLERLKEMNQEVLVLSFESFVMCPQEALDRLQAYLNRAHHPQIEKILKKQKVPRAQIMQGKGHAKYGWSGSQNTSEAEEYARQQSVVEKEASPERFRQFQELIRRYNDCWPSVLAPFA